jgi:indole-3-glycerol phosphate synthase
MGTILDKIVASKQREIAAARAAVPEDDVRQAAAEAPPVRDFFTALSGPGPIRLIAEIKKASPTAGVIRADFNPVDIARTYAQHGAACISVLTDEAFFQGSLDDLRAVRGAVDCPVLRKDFILDRYQLYQARAAGADAVLLIAECLDDNALPALLGEAVKLGMTPLVELYEPDNLPRVLDAGATLIGVNNRNLRTFKVDLDHTIRMRQHVPNNCLLVSESGIRTRQDVARLSAAGVDAMLVGESLMRAADVGTAVDELLSGSRKN